MSRRQRRTSARALRPSDRRRVETLVIRFDVLARAERFEEEIRDAARVGNFPRPCFVGLIADHVATIGYETEFDVLLALLGDELPPAIRIGIEAVRER